MKPVRFYEIFDNKLDVEMGTASPLEAVRWYARDPMGKSVFISVWDEENEQDFRLLQDRIEVTELIIASLAIYKEKER